MFARVVAGRTRLVGGCAVRCWVIKEHVDRATFPFYGQCAAPYTATDGLGTDAQQLGSLGYGRTTFGRIAILHAASISPLPAPVKALRRPDSAPGGL